MGPLRLARPRGGQARHRAAVLAVHAGAALGVATASAREPTVCGPNAKEYQAFFTAVVKRYNGKYSDENQGGGRLPKVDRFSVSNEPNLKSWLAADQSRSTAGIYRDMVYAAERRWPRAASVALSC